MARHVPVARCVWRLKLAVPPIVPAAIGSVGRLMAVNVLVLLTRLRCVRVFALDGEVSGGRRRQLAVCPVQ